MAFQQSHNNMITNTFGKLYLVPNLLGATKPDQVLPAGTLEIVKRSKHLMVADCMGGGLLVMTVVITVI